LTLLGLGAKYAPCMRPNETQYELTPTVPCGTLFPQTDGETVNGTCVVDYYKYLSYFCGMGGFTVPYQGWRFITPIFLHTGLIELAFTVVFQVWKGFQMEHDIGWWRMGIIYFLSGIFGVGWSANMTPNNGVISLTPSSLAVMVVLTSCFC
jgi:membrane associated rhomboid family serine protease